MAIKPRRLDINSRILQFRRTAGAAYHAWNANDPKGILESRELKNQPQDLEVMAYFGDDVSRSYQIEQWLPVFEELNKTHKVSIISRQFPTTKKLRKLTSLPVNTVYDFFTLTELIDSNNYKVVLYVITHSQIFKQWQQKELFMFI